MTSLAEKIVCSKVYFRIHEKDQLVGFADIILNDCLKIRGIRLINGAKGLFISFPSKKMKDDSFMDLVFPTEASLAEHIKSAVITEYERVKANPPEKKDYSKPSGGKSNYRGSSAPAGRVNAEEDEDVPY